MQLGVLIPDLDYVLVKSSDPNTHTTHIISCTERGRGEGRKEEEGEEGISLVGRGAIQM